MWKKNVDAMANTFGLFTLEWLLEGGDVTESTQEEDDDVAFVFNGRYLEQQPQRRTCANDQLHDRWDKQRKREERKKYEYKNHQRENWLDREK